MIISYSVTTQVSLFLIHQRKYIHIDYISHQDIKYFKCLANIYPLLIDSTEILCIKNRTQVSIKNIVLVYRIERVFKMFCNLTSIHSTENYLRMESSGTFQIANCRKFGIYFLFICELISSYEPLT